MTWKNSGDGVLKRYSYQYDAYNRLKAAIYQEPESFVPQNGFYNEFMSYDANGNITGLKRNQKGYTGTVEEIDELVYSYPTGNRLESVVDLKNNYAGYPETSGNIISYDDNGSMTSHIDKGILEIKYNILDLPSYVKFNNYVERLGQNVYRNMNYTYRADGVKVKKVHHYFSGKKSQDAFITTEYVDGFQYSIDTANLDLLVSNLKFFATSEGYFDFVNNRYIYHYNDHLGNVRVSFAREGNTAVIVQQNDYYAFGLRHSYGISAIGDYKYQYNGKELQEELGMYDYGARFYMPDIGRWGAIDPMSEVTPHLSPYHYANNNPIMYNDPTGMLSQSFIDELWNSPSGTTWTNSGNGYFYNNWGGMMDNEGNAQNYRSYSLAAQDNYMTGGGGGDVAGEILLPEAVINAQGNIHNWNIGTNYLNNVISMSMAFKKALSGWLYQEGTFVYDPLAGVKSDGPIKMIGGAGDLSGLLDIAGQVISNWEPENQGLAMAAGVIGAVALKKPGLAVKSEYYSVAYEMKLAKSSYPGVYRGGHFREANKALEAAIKSDARFASSMENLGIFIPKSPTGSILGKSPANWVWHHHIDEGIMQLVPKSQHTVGSSFWKTMHPGNKGGFYFWGK